MSVLKCNLKDFKSSDVPKLSSYSEKELKQDPSMPAFLKSYPHILDLTKNIERLEKTQEQQAKAASNPRREILIAILEVALSVSIVALTIVAICLTVSYLPGGVSKPVVLALCIGAFITLAILGSYYDHQWTPNRKGIKTAGGGGEGNYGYGLYIPVVGPIVAIVQSLRGPSRFNSAIEEQIEDVNRAFTAVQKEANKDQSDSLSSYINKMEDQKIKSDLEGKLDKINAFMNKFKISEGSGEESEED